MADLQSRPFRPDPQKCCERCCFGRGSHAAWCVVGHAVEAFTVAVERGYEEFVHQEWLRRLNSGTNPKNVFLGMSSTAP